MSTPRLQSTSTRPRSVTCYAVHAHSDPSVLPRVVGVLAKRGLTPDRWVGAAVGPRGEELQIDLQIVGLDPAVAEIVAQEMRKIVRVSSVMMSDKLISAAA